MADLSEAEKRRNEIAALLDRDQFLTDLLWLTALLKVSDEASDADKSVVWMTCQDIAYLRGWRWSHAEGRWVRKAAPDGHIPDSGPKTPPEASWDPTWARPEDL